MNVDQIQGKWQEIKGKVRQRWGKLTDDDLEQVHGKTEELRGIIQKRYGLTVEKAQKELEDFASQQH